MYAYICDGRFTRYDRRPTDFTGELWGGLSSWAAGATVSGWGLLLLLFSWGLLLLLFSGRCLATPVIVLQLITCCTGHGVT